MSDRPLAKAKKAKNDEFYTQLADIEEELWHYKQQFKGKTIYCNCDDPRVSNFFKYFANNYEFLGLRQLITACYKSKNIDMFSQNDSEQAVYLVYDGDKNGNRMPDIEEIGINDLQYDGDFRNQESIELLKKADVVCTNPPFSLFREYVAQLVEHNKKFLILGNKNAITYKEIFELIKENKMWVGNTPMGKDFLFDVQEEYAQEMLANKKEGSGYKIVDGVVKGRSQAVWFTNLDLPKRNEELILYEKYDSEKYPKYDNYDAINVDKVVEIPKEYDGYMGVPITFLDKYNPEQFEIFGMMNTGEKNEGIRHENSPHGRPVINGVQKYVRILIKNKRL